MGADILFLIADILGFNEKPSVHVGSPSLTPPFSLNRFIHAHRVGYMVYDLNEL